MSEFGLRLFDYLEQYAHIRAEILDAIDRVLTSGQLILGPEVARFESQFTEFLGASGECVGVNSGTDALSIAAKAFRIGPGDEVITVANTAVATVSAIRSAGATPVFCDVDPRTCLMDLDAMAACLTSRTRAVVPVHLYGNVVDVPALRERLDQRDVRVIEDCAQAHGAKFSGRAAGTFGDAAAFSFYPTKNLGAYGDAGICFTSDLVAAGNMRMLRGHGIGEGRCAEIEGINSRMDELQAAVLRVKLRLLPRYLSRRRELAAIYDSELPSSIERVAPGANVEHAYHLYVVKVPFRDAVREQLKRAGIATAIHYPVPVHTMPAYEHLGYSEGSLPETEALAGTILSLPLYPELGDEDVRRVCTTLRDILD